MIAKRGKCQGLLVAVAATVAGALAATATAGKKDGTISGGTYVMKQQPIGNVPRPQASCCERLQILVLTRGHFAVHLRRRERPKNERILLLKFL